MLINPFFNGIDGFTKSWMLFDTLEDLITDNTWSGGTLSSGQLVGSSTTNTLVDQSRFNTNSGEFTIEFDFTPDATDNNGSNHGLVSFGTGASNTSYFIRYANGHCAMVVQSSISAGFQFAISCNITGTTGQKYRIALQRKAGGYQMYLDGVLLTPAIIDNAVNSFASSSNQLRLGYVDAGVAEAMGGAMGNFKFSNGIARY